LSALRIAFVAGYDWSVPGGVQNQVASLAGALARQGHEVVVIAPRRHAGTGPPIDGFTFVAAGRGIEIPVNGSVAPVAPTPVAVAATVRALHRFRPDVTHVHEPLLPGPPLASVLAGPRPVVATFHRADADRLYQAEARALGWLAMRRCAALTAVSAAAAETARSVLGTALGRVVEVPNGIEVERFDAARRRVEQQAAGTRPWKDGVRPVVAFVGRHERRKGADLLMRAAQWLPDDLRVVVAGDGPETDRLRQLAAGDQRIEFPGRLDDAGVAALMAAADVLVAPARGGESFGLVIVEAMAAGTAVVCSDLPGYLSAASGAARVFHRDDARDLARAVADVVIDESLRHRLVDAGALRARACAIEVVAEQYAGVYRSVVATPGRSRSARRLLVGGRSRSAGRLRSAGRSRSTGRS
jgi:phosphatidylinositol alpha-mannosyltransferase